MVGKCWSEACYSNPLSADFLFFQFMNHYLHSFSIVQ